MKWTCSVCGYVYEGPEPPAQCPQCKVGADKFIPVAEGKTEWADQHVVGVAAGVDPEIIEGLRANFTGECSEVGPSSVDSTMKVPTHDLPSYPQTLENTGVCPYFFVAKFFLL